MTQLFPECGEHHGTRRRSSNGRSPTPLATCQGCGVVFRPKHSKATTYHSRECAFKNGATAHWKTKPPRWATRLQRHVRKQQKAFKRALVPCEMCCKPRGRSAGSKYCRACAPKLQTLGQGYTGFRSLICVECQKPRQSSSVRYVAGKRCDACELVYRRKQKRKYHTGSNRKRCRDAGTEYDSSVTLHALLERHGSRCALCGKMTRPDWHYWHDMYPSIEHIIPPKLGGGHTWDNVQVAHRICNSIKGEQIKGQLRLW